MGGGGVGGGGVGGGGVGRGGRDGAIEGGLVHQRRGSRAIGALSSLLCDFDLIPLGDVEGRVMLRGM